jgi:hypothetical protein
MIRVPVVSSNLASVGHEDTTLEVEFKNGQLYHYFGVSQELYQELLNAESVGKFLNTNIKPERAYTRVGLTEMKTFSIDIKIYGTVYIRAHDLESAKAILEQGTPPDFRFNGPDVYAGPFEDLPTHTFTLAPEMTPHGPDPDAVWEEHG